MISDHADPLSDSLELQHKIFYERLISSLHDESRVKLVWISAKREEFPAAGESQALIPEQADNRHTLTFDKASGLAAAESPPRSLDIAAPTPAPATGESSVLLRSMPGRMAEHTTVKSEISADFC